MNRVYEPRAYGMEPIAQNYWRETHPWPTSPRAEGEIRCDVAIIGGGFTGLNAAIELAKSGQNVAVFETLEFGFGASGRNGGFCCLGGDALGPAKIERRYGPEDAAKYRNLQRAAIDHVDTFLAQSETEVDRHSHGETEIAHTARAARNLGDMAEAFSHYYGLPCRVIPKEALRQEGLDGAEFHGAITYQTGFALNPLKYLMALYQEAKAHGVQLFANSAVTETKPFKNRSWLLKTAHSDIRAQKMLLATNGYGDDTISAWNNGRYLPVQSDIIITRPLSDAELMEQGFNSEQMCYDSRYLLHYFRLLPERRFLFGMRGAIGAGPKAALRAKARAKSHLARMFPKWRDVEITHHWSGFICATLREIPFIGPMRPFENAWAAFGYHGNGVSMGSYAGRLIADQILGRTNASVPAFIQVPPRRFPFGRWRRNLLWPAYAKLYLQDQ